MTVMYGLRFLHALPSVSALRLYCPDRWMRDLLPSFIDMYMTRPHTHIQRDHTHTAVQNLILLRREDSSHIQWLWCMVWGFCMYCPFVSVGLSTPTLRLYCLDMHPSHNPNSFKIHHHALTYLKCVFLLPTLLVTIQNMCSAKKQLYLFYWTGCWVHNAHIAIHQNKHINNQFQGGWTDRIVTSSCPTSAQHYAQCGIHIYEAWWQTIHPFPTRSYMVNAFIIILWCIIKTRLGSWLGELRERNED